jgi:hypothetical protein
MAELQVGQQYSNRVAFGNALKAYAVGSFGDPEKFPILKDSSMTVTYKCKTCKKWDGVNAMIRVKRIAGDTTGKVVTSGGPVTIIHWERCYCAIEERKATSQLPGLPAVGVVYDSRNEWGEAMTDFCTKNRKQRFKLKDNGNKMTRTCPKEGCPGEVVVHLVERKREGDKKKSWVPPLTVTTSVPCWPGCREVCAEVTTDCCLCLEPKTKSELVSGLCCKYADTLCLPCLKKACQARPVHCNAWPGSDSIYNMVVTCGPGRGQVWFRCPIAKCEWTTEQSFTYNNVVTLVKDLVPFGFRRNKPINDRRFMKVLMQKFGELKRRKPELNQPRTERMQIRIAREILRNNWGR